MPEYDVLVVGGGFAGMSAAISAREQGAKVAIVSKLHPLRSHSSGTHSGINASLRGQDSWEAHALDTVAAGDHLGEQDAIETLCQEAPQEVIRMEHMGVPFSRDDQGRIDQVRFAGSSQPRTCYCGDSAGHVLLQVLFEQVLRHEIPLYHEWFATSLIVHDGSCSGIFARDLKTGVLETYSARAVVLATGGIGRLYQPSTSSIGATADGMALAYRAGVPLRDMEMVQFGPTTLKSRGILITEAARGEGAHLINSEGNRFMEGYAADAMEMATRDVCARAIEKEIAEGRGSNGYVYLDFRHLDKDRIADRLPETQALVKDLAGVDLTKEPVPVRPAMHRPIGGIQVDIQGSTSMSGLFATGECANTGVHGANRLGGNSLLECVVMGRRAGASASEHAKATQLSPAPKGLLADEEKRIQTLLSRDRGKNTLGGLRRELATLMHAKVGIYRDEAGLTEAGKNIEKIRDRYQKLGVQDRAGSFNSDVVTILELGHMIDVAGVIVASALERKESRGTHHRLDFPKRDDKNWLTHIIAKPSPDGPKLENQPVTVTRWQPEGSA